MKSEIESKIRQIETFKASKHWFYNFMNRKIFSRFKLKGEIGILRQNSIEGEILELKKVFCTYDIADILNTGKVSVLFRSLTSRDVCTTDEQTAYKRVRDRLTSLLSVHEDGRKGPVVIIDKSKGPESFSKRFVAERDLGFTYLRQDKAWNTQTL